MIALDIFIGLVLIYFLYALLVSIIAEMISTWIGLRARLLRQGIDNILNDKTPGVNNKKDFTNWIKDIFVVEPKEFKYTLAGRFYKEPTIKYLAKTGENEVYSIRNTKPAYISKENFTLTILNMLSRRTQGIHEWDKIKFAIKHNAIALEPETFKMFQDWVDRSNDQYGNFITNVERTYEEMMDRVNGWYKRKIGLFIFWIGFAICVIMNVDTFEIVKILANSPDKAKAMAELAIDVVNAENNYRNDTTRNDSIKNNTASLNLINAHYQAVDTSIKRTRNILANGWVFPDSIYTKKFLIWQKSKHIVSNSRPFGIKFWGIVITALALSLGSQFWYDLLKKLVSLRGAGVKPEERDSELKKEMAIKKNGNDGLAVMNQDPVKLVIARHKNYWESMPGFISINEVYDQAHRRSIKLTFEKNRLPFIEKEFEEVGEIVIVKCNEGMKGQLNIGTEPKTGAIIQGSMKTWGSVAGIVSNPRTGKLALLTCGHVIRTSNSSFLEEDKRDIFLQIIQNDKKERIRIGMASNMVMSGYCDAGIIDLNISLSQLNKHKIFEPITEFREVALSESENTKVTIRTLQNSISGTIVKTDEYFSFKLKGDQDIKYLDLLKIVPDHNQNLSEEGDSGSMIVDATSEIPIGILVGVGVEDGINYIFGIKIKDVFEILQIKSIS